MSSSALGPLPQILMYHHVEPGPLAPPAVHPSSYLTPDAFARGLDLLQRRGFETVTLTEAVRAARNGEGKGRKSRRRTVVLTFDDGCRCFRDHALPLLRERAMTATLFALAGELGGTNRWDRAGSEAAGEGSSPAEHPERLEHLLDAEGLREVRRAGMEVGCHGDLHRDLTALPPGEAGEELLDAETRGARERLEAVLEAPVTSFCYPYGRVDRRAREAVRRAGFEAAVAIVDHGIARPGDPWALPRWPVGPADSPFEMGLKAGGAYRWWRRLPRLGVLGALRTSQRRRARGSTPREDRP